MTKKRYFNIIPSGIQDIKTGKIIRGSKIGDLLNEQEEEINTLKSLIIDDENKLRELKEENGNLKFAYDLLTSHIDANYDEYMTQMRLHARIKELENELELYRHYIEFVPSSGDTE